MAFDITQTKAFGDIKKTTDDSFKIVEIDIDKLIPNERNFYSTDEIEDLKNTIEALGIQENLIVEEKNEDGLYKLIAGHRRVLATKELITEGRLDIKTLPCKIDTNSELERRIILIITNSTARELSAFEKMKQVAEMKEIAKELNENPDTKIKGSTRDYIAQMLKMSPTEVARYDSINKKLDTDIKVELESENISTDTAYEISKLKPEQQEEIKEVIKEAKAENRKVTTNDVKIISKKENNKINTPVVQDDWQFEEQISIEDKNNSISSVSKESQLKKPDDETGKNANYDNVDVINYDAPLDEKSEHSNNEVLQFVTESENEILEIIDLYKDRIESIRADEFNRNTRYVKDENEIKHKESINNTIREYEIIIKALEFYNNHYLEV